jgi:hypothetical protein
MLCVRARLPLQARVCSVGAAFSEVQGGRGGAADYSIKKIKSYVDMDQQFSDLDIFSRKVEAQCKSNFEDRQ